MQSPSVFPPQDDLDPGFQVTVVVGTVTIMVMTTEPGEKSTALESNVASTKNVANIRFITKVTNC